MATLQSSLSESINVEFKSSLFFRAGTQECGEEQIGVIMRTIAGFMNAEGGDLYIGLNDDGKAVNDVRNEYTYLNAFPPYATNTYHSNEDSYRRFIIDWAGKELGTYAATMLLRIDFIEENGIKIACVHISKAFAPVWYKGESLFVRGDGFTRRLKGDMITSFFQHISQEELEKKMEKEESSLTAKIDNLKATVLQPMNKLLVVYPNGDYIYEKSSVQTMLEVIRRAGINEVLNLGLTGRKGKGKTPYVPFISSVQYHDNAPQDSKTQKEMDGYYVFVKYSVGDLMSKILQISNGLGLQLHVEVY